MELIYFNFFFFFKEGGGGGGNRFGRHIRSSEKHEDSAVNRHEFRGLHAENGRAHKL